MASGTNESSPTPQQFTSLSRREQLERLRRMTPRKRVELLAELEQGAALLAQLPVQETFQMVKALGLERCADLLKKVRPEHWTTFFDFDCWSGDRLDPDRARPWVSLLLQGDDDHLARRLQRIDFELLTLMLKKEITVLAGPEAIEDEDARAETHLRDGGYQLAYRDEDAAKLYGALLKRLFAAAPDFCRYLLEAVRGETESLVEENVYRQRIDRFHDLGFPDPSEARLVYAWLDPDGFGAADACKVAVGLVDAGPAPDFVLTLYRPDGLLGEILDAGVDEATAWELTCLINKVTLADGVDVGDLDQVQQCIRKVYGLLEVALEFLAGTQIERAAETFRTTYCEHLFRLGFSLTLRLRRRADRVHASAVGPYLDPPFQLLIESLRQDCPQLYFGLEEEGRNDAGPFSRLHQVESCDAWLDLIEAQQRLFEQHFDFSLLPPEEFDLEGLFLESVDDLSLSELFLTALANRLLGRAFQPDPLAPGDLPELHRRICDAGQVNPQLVDETVTWLENLEPGGGAFARYCLEFWQDAFCNLAANDLDPRFIGGLLITS